MSFQFKYRNANLPIFQSTKQENQDIGEYPQTNVRYFYSIPPTIQQNETALDEIPEKDKTHFEKESGYSSGYIIGKPSISISEL